MVCKGLVEKKCDNCLLTTTVLQVIDGNKLVLDGARRHPAIIVLQDFLKETLQKPCHCNHQTCKHCEHINC